MPAAAAAAATPVSRIRGTPVRFIPSPPHRGPCPRWRRRPGRNASALSAATAIRGRSRAVGKHRKRGSQSGGTWRWRGTATRSATSARRTSAASATAAAPARRRVRSPRSKTDRNTAKFSETRAHAELRGRLAIADTTMNSISPLSRRPVARASGPATARRRPTARSAAARAAAPSLVAAAHQHAVAVARVAEPAQRHREAALDRAVAPRRRRPRSASASSVRRRCRAGAPDLAPCTRPAATRLTRLPDAAHRAALQA